MLRKRGRKPLLVGLDVYRPAAMDQLEILGKQINVPVARAENGETDVLALWRRAQEIGVHLARFELQIYGGPASPVLAEL